jgi:hypothetical protein
MEAKELELSESSGTPVLVSLKSQGGVVMLRNPSLYLFARVCVSKILPPLKACCAYEKQEEGKLRAKKKMLIKELKCFASLLPWSVKKKFVEEL